MKKYAIAIAALVFLSSFAASAQDTQKAVSDALNLMNAADDVKPAAPKPKYWTESLMTNISFTQTSLKSWAAGGYNNVTLSSYVDANANYAKDKMVWKNRLQMDYGFLYSDDKPIIQKNKDRFYLESNWAYATPVVNLSYSATFDFKTQFDNNYNYGNPAVENPTSSDWKSARVLKSGLMAPGYVNLGFGLKWEPAPWFTINATPLTGGLIVVDIPQLRKTYGMKLEEGLEDLPENYRSAKFTLGAQVKTDLSVQVNDNFKYSTQLVLFSNYLENPQNLRVNWDNKIFWKLAKYFTMTVSTNLIYDETILIPADKNHDAPYKGVQFKEFLEFGFTYTIASKK